MSKSACPLVSILMRSYNSERYIAEAIESIIAQTYSNWELLVLDDCSQDETQEIVTSYSDKRVKFCPGLHNVGLVENLNRGKELAQGEYVAIMDSDDISLPERLQVQVDFMENHPQIMVVGSTIIRYNASMTEALDRIVYPTSPQKVRVDLLATPPFAQPAVMVRGSYYRTEAYHYDRKFSVSEDYELWSRICFQQETTNIDRVLLHYRWHEANTCNTYAPKQERESDTIRTQIIRRFFPNWSEGKVQDYLRFLVGIPQKITRSEFEASLETFEELARVMKQDASIDFKYFRDFIFQDRIRLFLLKNKELSRIFSSRIYKLCCFLEYPYAFSLKWYLKLFFKHV